MSLKLKSRSDQPTSVVTGAAGFLGSHLCDRLLREGHEVICADNLITGNLKNIAHLFGREGFRFLKQDVTEYLYIEGPVQYILHFASPASPVDYLRLPIQTLKVGSLGTHKALGLAKKERDSLAFETRQLLAAGEIVRIKQDRLCRPRDADLVTGRIQFRQGGSAYVIRDRASGAPEQDAVQISAEDTGVAIHGDRVVVRLSDELSRPRGVEL